MLEIQGLTKAYGKYKAADGVSFAVGNGEIGILLGPKVPENPRSLRALRVFCGIREGFR